MAVQGFPGAPVGQSLSDVQRRPSAQTLITPPPAHAREPHADGLAAHRLHRGDLVLREVVEVAVDQHLGAGRVQAVDELGQQVHADDLVVATRARERAQRRVLAFEQARAIAAVAHVVEAARGDRAKEIGQVGAAQAPPEEIHVQRLHDVLGIGAVAEHAPGLAEQRRTVAGVGVHRAVTGIVHPRRRWRCRDSRVRRSGSRHRRRSAARRRRR